MKHDSNEHNKQFNNKRQTTTNIATIFGGESAFELPGSRFRSKAAEERSKRSSLSKNTSYIYIYIERDIILYIELDRERYNIIYM